MLWSVPFYLHFQTLCFFLHYFIWEINANYSQDTQIMEIIDASESEYPRYEIVYLYAAYTIS